MEKKHQLNFGYILIAIWLVLLFQLYFGPASRQADITYSQFEQYLDNGRIQRVAIDEQYIRGDFTEQIDGKTGFITPRMEIDLADKLADYNVEYTGVVTNNFITNLMSWFAPVFIFALVWLFIFRKFASKQGLGGMMNIGKTKAQVLVEKNTGVSFTDVAGVDEAKDELIEVVQFLKAPEKFNKLGAHIPKGVLLVGPPGTGKTLIARAVAGEANVPFFSISGAEFIEMFVGVGAARVRDLFEQAKAHAPAIIFIDELDALGRARGLGPQMGGHDEREQTLNQLLSEMDGFNPADGVIILAATNRPEILDAALLRAGRFDRQVLVDRPDKTGREQILRVHSRKITLDRTVNLADVAALTTGFSGADLANLVNEAAIMATRRKGQSVTMDDFVSAIERIIAGLEKRNKLIDPQEKNIVAHHEMGHAIVAMTLNPDQVIQKVSVIPRGIGALGYTIQRPSDDRFLQSRHELQNRMAILFAGRAAEKLIFNEVTTGAADDLAKATDIARAMVMQYGMAEETGLLSMEQKKNYFLEQQYGQNQGIESYGPEMAQK
ncbi:MAG: ATP-dependent zinc metalloprotease FtsH, partial [Pseudohongiellaceae bacterium]